MATDHPFQQLFETFGKLPEAHAENVNAGAREKIKERISAGLEKGGHCILLKAPRAGHGKTHLLTRLQHELGGTHEFVPLHALGGSRIDAATAMDDILRRLVRPLPAAAGLTVLDLAARRLFSSSLQPLVRSGEVPCQDREGALNALRTRPIETFDFHHPSAVTAHWARENFELLGPRLSIELSQRNGLSLREVSFWVNAMFRFAATPIDNPGRVRALAKTVFDDPAGDADAHERLVGLLGLMTSLMRVVLVADELEGFSSDETAALRFASFIGALRQSVDRLDVIISVNQDVWNSAFLPRLSGGLADRLSEVVVELKPLERGEKIAILESRSPGMGVNILNELDGDALPSYARGLIRKAAEKFEVGDAPKQKEQSSQPQVSEEPAQQEAPSTQADVSSESADSASKQEEQRSESKDTPEGGQAHPAPPEIPVREKADMNDAQDFASSLEKSPPVSVSTFPPSPLAEPEPGLAAPVSQSTSWPAPEVAPSQVSGFSEVEVPSAPLRDAQPPVPAEIPSPDFRSQQSFESAHPQSGGTVGQEEPSQTGFETQFEQAPPVQPAPEQPVHGEEMPEDKSDRVDNLLRQFRERYGKS